MATTPAFAATVNNGSAIAHATLDTSLTAPTNVATVFTAGASGSKIEEIVVQGLGTTVAGMCNLFLYDGTTYHLFDQFTVSAVTSSTTAAAYRVYKTYSNVVLKSGWSLRFTQTIAGNQSMLKVSAFGGDF